MSMTTKSFGNQLNPTTAVAGQEAADQIDGLAEVPVVIAANGPAVVASLKPGDPNWSHCDILNDHK
jgi:hypothetical protein